MVLMAPWNSEVHLSSLLEGAVICASSPKRRSKHPIGSLGFAMFATLLRRPWTPQPQASYAHPPASLACIHTSAPSQKALEQRGGQERSFLALAHESCLSPGLCNNSCRLTEAAYQLGSPAIHMAQRIEWGLWAFVVGQGITVLYVTSLVKGWASNTQDTKVAVGVNGTGNNVWACLLCLLSFNLFTSEGSTWGE